MPYDSATNTFSPEGRLYQVEYASETVAKAPTALAMVTKESVVFAGERRERSKLLDIERPELRNYSGDKVYRIDDHIAVGVAGLVSDANHLIDKARGVAQQHKYTFQEPLPCEDLCRRLCDIKQGVTMSGGLRPYGIAFLVGGWDRNHGFQLYQTDPSGNYFAWKAYTIGQNNATAQSMLKTDWKEDFTTKDGILLALKILGKTMDTITLNPERLEVAVLSKKPGEEPNFSILTTADLKPYVAEADSLRKKDEDEKESARKARTNKD